MPIEPQQPEFRQVVALLRDAITSGEFPPGSQLPAEPELADRYDTSRATINRALSVLRTEGLIRPERGRGTTVRKLPAIRRSTIGRQARAAREEGGARGAFAGELQRLGLTPRSEVTTREMDAPADVAALLGLDAPESEPAVFTRTRVMFADDEPVQLSVSYFRLEVADTARITEPDTGPGGVYSRLADANFEPVRFREIVRVRPPAAAEAIALNLDADHRVYDITRTAHTSWEEVVEVARMVLPAHLWELETEWGA